MIVQISSDAEQDLADGFWFCEGQAAGLGDYFRSSIMADIESLAFHGAIHERVAGYHRSLSRRFPFTIYYRVDGDQVTVVAVLDVRRSPSWIRNRLGR
jgi:plasmid stabilization system protein ParE